jgi:DNA-binding MarR family transcriptional regulator
LEHKPSAEEQFARALEVRVLALIVSKRATASLEQRLQDQGAPVTAMQYEVMRLLSYHAYTISELSRKIRVDPATLVPVIDALERHNLAQRARDPSDRRRVPVLLTEAGTALLRRIPFFDESDSLFAALDAMGAEVSAQFLDLLRQLVQHMDVEGRPDTLAEVAATIQIARDMFAREHTSPE